MAKNNISIWNAKFDHTYKYIGKNGIHYEYLMPKDSNDSRFFEEAYDVKSRNNKTGRYQPIGDKSYFTFYQLLHNSKDSKGFMKLNIQLFASILIDELIEKFIRANENAKTKLQKLNIEHIDQWEKNLIEQFGDLNGNDFYEQLGEAWKWKMINNTSSLTYDLKVTPDSLDIIFNGVEPKRFQKIKQEMNDWIEKLVIEKVFNDTEAQDRIRDDLTNYMLLDEEGSSEILEQQINERLLFKLKDEISRDKRFLGWIDEAKSINNIGEGYSDSLNGEGDFKFFGIPLENKLNLDHFRITENSDYLPIFKPWQKVMGVNPKTLDDYTWKELLSLSQEYPKLKTVVDEFIVLGSLLYKFQGQSMVAGFTNSGGDFLPWPNFISDVTRIVNVNKNIAKDQKVILWYK